MCAKPKVLCVVGARPNFMKVASVMKALGEYPEISSVLLHTGQHYDVKMSKVFFEDLEIQEPDIYLGVGSGSHAEQTAQIMLEFEKVLLGTVSHLVVVFGDVNSTLACGIVAAKCCVPLAHVEAGLRSFDNTMPEEINRRVTDLLSDYLFTTCREANKNLKKEGISTAKIFFVGNVMVDTIFHGLKKLKENQRISFPFNVTPKEYALLTLHRPSNVDIKDRFLSIMSAIARVSEDIKVIFPVHPRTKSKLSYFVSPKTKTNLKGIIFTEPLRYLDFLQLMVNAKFVLTDSGGIQEETTVLSVPCLTLRNNTERPITVSQGTNIIVGVNPDKIILQSKKILAGKVKRGKIPPLWDGKAGPRIAKIIVQKVLKSENL